MPNLSNLAPITTAATALSNLVLVSPQATEGLQPQNKFGEQGALPKAFLFHYEGEQSVTLESDITDHYVEDNTAVADQIALKPEIYTTRGYIGELNNVVPGLLKPLKFAADKLTNITGYAPALSTTALIAYNQAFFLYQVAANAANSAVSAWSSISSLFGGGTGPQNKQQVAFQELYGYWRERRLFTVQTPWAVFQNMSIQRLKSIQDEETNAITDFEITFKMIRVASTQKLGTGLSAANLFQGQAASQAAKNVNLGTSSPVPSSSLSSFLA